LEGKRIDLMAVEKGPFIGGREIKGLITLGNSNNKNKTTW
jgi:hypothetical protein